MPGKAELGAAPGPWRMAQGMWAVDVAGMEGIKMQYGLPAPSPWHQERVRGPCGIAHPSPPVQPLSHSDHRVQTLLWLCCGGLGGCSSAQSHSHQLVHITLAQTYQSCSYQMVGFQFIHAGNQMLSSPGGSCAPWAAVLQLSSVQTIPGFTFHANNSLGTSGTFT